MVPVVDLGSISPISVPEVHGGSGCCVQVSPSWLTQPPTLLISVVEVVQATCELGSSPLAPTCLSLEPAKVLPSGDPVQKPAEGVLSVPQCWVSPVEESGCTGILLKLGFRLSSDRNSLLGHIKLSGGLISKAKRLVILDFVPRWIGTPFPDQFLEFLRAGSMGFGVSSQEVNTFSSKELLSFPREVMFARDAVDFSVGFGENEMSVCLPLQIIDPSVSTNLEELEEATELLSIENKVDISSWMKHRIPGFSKLVGLSTTRHEKLCIALLQRLETEMEAANVLHERNE